MKTIKSFTNHIKEAGITLNKMNEQNSSPPVLHKRNFRTSLVTMSNSTDPSILSYNLRSHSSFNVHQKSKRRNKGVLTPSLEVMKKEKQSEYFMLGKSCVPKASKSSRKNRDQFWKNSKLISNPYTHKTAYLISKRGSRSNSRKSQHSKLYSREEVSKYKSDVENLDNWLHQTTQRRSSCNFNNKYSRE